VLSSLLARPDVTEECELRSTFGFMAYHGGTLEKATDVIARDAAARSGSSFYAIVQCDPDPLHVPSTEIEPSESPAMTAFLDHVDVVVTVHGYGRDELRHSVLVGGTHVGLGDHLAAALEPRLKEYRFLTAPEEIPSGLRGRHRDNPVNRPRDGGVQLELPPTLRWHSERHGWSDDPGVGRAPQVEALVEGLAAAVRSWSRAGPRVATASAQPLI
jgi:phage replication-related protein YjqB (UPF0714/DUF867 family)